jgi:uncharacterized phage protein (TIGR02218 family)
VAENRVSQAGTEALFRVIPGADVSQAGAEYLHRVIPGTRTSQAGAEYLHRVQPSFAISQAGVEFLYKHVPCGTRWAQIWTITRTDGVVYRFTSLDRDLDWKSETFKACNSLVPSASEAVADMGSAGTMDLSGAVGEGGISELALHGGLLDGAYVEAWLVSWAPSSLGPTSPSGADGSSPKRLLRGNFGPVQHDSNGFKVDLLGDGAKLTQTPLVRTLAPGCWKQFGDEFCTVDLEPLTVTGTVDSSDSLRSFADAERVEVAGYFTRGIVTFTSGMNSGISAEIKEHAAGGSFTLWPKLAFPILPGITYSMVPGCTNLKAASGGCNGCTAWANEINYGGFDKVPGRDKRGGSAEVKGAG